MATEEKKVKNVKLTDEVMLALSIQGKKLGYTYLSNYMEHILIEQSKKK